MTDDDRWREARIPSTVAGRAGYRAVDPLEIEIVGTVIKPDTTALDRLGLVGNTLLAQADFALTIKETALGKPAHDLDGDAFPFTSHSCCATRVSDQPRRGV